LKIKVSSFRAQHSVQPTGGIRRIYEHHPRSKGILLSEFCLVPPPAANASRWALALENKFGKNIRKVINMEQVSNSADTTQISVARKMLALENQIKGGTSWFFWIAGLSILNSIIFFTGGSITFVVGLGATQIIDGFVSALVKEVSSGAGTIFRVIGFGLDFLFAGVFAVGGILGRKKIRWAVIVGMVLYGFDGLLSLAFGDWLSTIFHILALSGLWRSQKAISELMLLEKSQSAGDLTSLQKLIAEKPPVDTATYQKNIIRFSLIIVIPFLLLLAFLVIMVLVNSK